MHDPGRAYFRASSHLLKALTRTPVHDSSMGVAEYIQRRSLHVDIYLDIPVPQSWYAICGFVHVLRRLYAGVSGMK